MTFVCLERACSTFVDSVLLLGFVPCSHFVSCPFRTDISPSPSGRAGIHILPRIIISWLPRSNTILCFVMNGVPSMQSYSSRFAMSRKVSTWTNSKLIIAVVAKLTFDLLPEQPSCNVTGLSSARRGNSATRARSGLTASVVLPESKSVYTLIPLMETYATRHISSPFMHFGRIIVPTGQVIVVNVLFNTHCAYVYNVSSLLSWSSSISTYSSY